MLLNVTEPSMQSTGQWRRAKGITSSLQSALWDALKDARVDHNLVHAPVKLRQSVHECCSFLLVNGIRMCGSLQLIHADSDIPPVELFGVTSTHHADCGKLCKSWIVQVALV